MTTTETYVKPTIEVIHLELEAPVLTGSNQTKGSGWG